MSNWRENIVLIEKLADEYLDKSFSSVICKKLHLKNMQTKLGSEEPEWNQRQKMALKGKLLSWNKGILLAVLL